MAQSPGAAGGGRRARWERGGEEPQSMEMTIFGILHFACASRGELFLLRACCMTHIRTSDGTRGLAVLLAVGLAVGMQAC